MMLIRYITAPTMENLEDEKLSMEAFMQSHKILALRDMAMLDEAKREILEDLLDYVPADDTPQLAWSSTGEGYIDPSTGSTCFVYRLRGTQPPGEYEFSYNDVLAVMILSQIEYLDDYVAKPPKVADIDLDK